MRDTKVKASIGPITNSVLNSHCFAWHPYGKLELFKTELVITTVYRQVTVALLYFTG